ncbi:hypothetical protein F5884DRAFT_792174 [Xylogone sp. PMI_703]|nr:hypothetical protein F5884DRAFT_792174 [Xylogone sp. PMI_703]
MSSDAHLYGIRKPKNQTKEISSSTSLAFASTLSSLLSSSKRADPSTSSSTTTTSAGRPRPSKTKDDIFKTHNKNTKKRALRDLEEDESDFRAKLGRQDLGAVDAEVLHRSKRKMEQKARLYAEMKKGDYVAGEDDPDALVDFDRKWAESRDAGAESSESDDDERSSGKLAGSKDEVVEYEDEYGRLRRGTKADAERMEKKKRNKLLGQEELDRMSARPAMPTQLIYGDTIQAAAFDPDESTAQQMEDIARKHDRSPTPPEKKHYEADKEIRTKGVGFYSFSKDEKVREAEMEALEKERAETERLRKEREGMKQARKKEIEERRKAISEKRAKKQADAFLDGLTSDLGIEGRDGAG